MENWNWKCECCLVFGGLMIGGPLGTIFLRKIQETVENNALNSHHKYHRYLLPSNSDDDEFGRNSNFSLLVPSSLWFLVTTSCVGIFFWVLGEILRKLHSASAPTTTRSRSVQGGGREGQAIGERANGGRMEEEDRRGPGENDHNYLIYHFGRRRLIFPYLPHERVRLWGISFI